MGAPVTKEALSPNTLQGNTKPPQNEPPAHPPFEGDPLAITVVYAEGERRPEEAAILFADGFNDAAEASLRQGLLDRSMGKASEVGAAMLFELLHQTKPADESAKERQLISKLYPKVAWAPVNYPADQRITDELEQTEGVQRAPDGSLSIRGAAGEGALASALGMLAKMPRTPQGMRIDLSSIRSIDGGGAKALAAVIAEHARNSSPSLTIIGGESLLIALREAVTQGSTKSDQRLWELLLELLWLLNRQEEFEECALEFCLETEISPPSWDESRARTGIRTEKAVAAPPPQPAAGTAGVRIWGGVIRVSDAEAFQQITTNAARGVNQVFDCTYLKRITLGAACALQSALRMARRTNANVKIEFRHLNPLVAGLFALLEIDQQAQVIPRATQGAKAAQGR